MHRLQLHDDTASPYAVGLHLLQGMATCAFIFPEAGLPIRKRLISN